MTYWHFSLPRHATWGPVRKPQSKRGALALHLTGFTRHDTTHFTLRPSKMRGQRRAPLIC